MVVVTPLLLGVFDGPMVGAVGWLVGELCKTVLVVESNLKK